MLFSIITVCYNDLKGLKLTYNSVLNQKCSDYEMIIVDGNSKDGTPQWLNELNNPAVIWSSEKDKGIFDAMNKGLKKAKGEYTIFMNSYDEFADGEVLLKIAEQVKQCSSTPEFIYGDSIDVTLDGKNLYKKARHYTQLWRGLFTVHQAMLFKNNPEIIYPPEYPITADYAFIGLHLQKINKENILALDFPVCRFKLGGTNEIERFKALHEDYNIRRKILKHSRFYASFLYLLHYIHTLMKRCMPGFTHAIRYKKK